MKILSRLRALPRLARATVAQPPVLEAAPLIDRDEVDFDEYFYSVDDDSLLDLEASGGTVDGLRRRIPELHEDFPPDGLGMEEQQGEPL